RAAMRLSFRLICALVVVMTVVSLLFSYAQFKGERRGLEQDLQRRAQILADSLQESIEPVLEKRSRRTLQQLVERFGNREHLAGIAIYDPQETPIAITSDLQKRFPNDAFAPSKIKGYRRNAREFLRLNSTYLNVHSVPLETDQGSAGTLVVVHDADYINAQTSKFWKRVSLRVVVEIILIGITALLIIRWTIEGPAARTLQWIKASRAGKVSSQPALSERDLFMPLRNEVTTLVQSLAAARESAEKEARLREAGDSMWTAERLAVHVRSKLNSSRLFVVSNREPYMHS